MNKQVELLSVFLILLARMLTARRLHWLVLLLSVLGVSTVVQASTVAVVLSDDSAPYHETADAIEAALGPDHAAIRVLSNKLAVSDSALSRARLLITVGVKATELVAERGGKTPVLAVLVTEDWYQKEGRSHLADSGRQAGVIVLDQPFPRQFRLIKSAFPNASKVGMVVGRANAGQLDQLGGLARAQQLTLVGAVSESESSLVSTLGQVLSDADLLLAVPDPDVLNRNTVQSVLMTTYRYRDPVVGYSKSLARAGALISLYSTPDQIGRQAGEIAAKVLNGAKLNGVQWPKYYSVSVNEHVARSLGLNLPSEETLMRELRENGGTND